MRRILKPISQHACFVVAGIVVLSCNSSPGDSIKMDGLQEPVEIIVDQWGVAHIYAANEQDLFYTQGYNAARDRLFQLEIWRRQATGTVSEILGEKELKRDIGTRLFKFRGDMTEEMKHYHPNGELIIKAFVQGVNAYIDLTRNNPELLPPEFGILEIEPGRWTPEVVISRHQGLLGNIGQELRLGRAVAALGSELVRKLSYFVPRDPDLTLDPTITSEMLAKDILGLYNAFRRNVSFPGEASAVVEMADWKTNYPLNMSDIGSNNWTVSGVLTSTGRPMMANDPHRIQAIPSLRYWVHLSAPGWDVIGGGEPEIPGVSIGHNGYGAWGLTVFRTDAEDLYVYDLNPENLNQYMYQGEWVDMEIIAESIPVRGMNNYDAELKYTKHGPVTFIDSVLNKGYAVRCGWLEIGGSPYLASLRMDQAQSWENFREACTYSNIPGENMIWADVDGNIGWQAVGIAPIRRNWSGLLPVPGDGRFEWDGYLPIIDKPHVTNPEAGYFKTANEYVVPEGYPHMDAIGFGWSDPFRGQRIADVLESGKELTMDDMIALQTDYFSIPASILVPMLAEIDFEDAAVKASHELVSTWNFELSPGSVAAGIYVAWERALQAAMYDYMIGEKEREYITSLSMTKTIQWLSNPTEVDFGPLSVEQRDNIMRIAFASAVELLKSQYGEDRDNWVYGQVNYKHITIEHALTELIASEDREIYNVGPVPRGGNSYTLNSTAWGNNQTSGASFRIIVDLGNLDNSVGCNSPGQSGDPRSDHYKDLFDIWAKDEYFPVIYSRDRVEKNMDFKIRLTPVNQLK